MSLSWRASTRTDITGYQYRFRAGDAGWSDWTNIPGSSAATTSYTVRDLTNTISHHFEVRVAKGNLYGPAARVSATPTGPPTTPSTPRDLFVVSRDGALYVGWKLPAEDSRAPVLSYSVRHRQMGSSRWTTVSHPLNTSGTTSEGRDIRGLTNRRHYEVQVAAVNRFGTGAWVSATGTPQAPAEPPPPPDNQPEDDELNVGPLGAHWTDGYRSDTIHPDTVRFNMNSISNDCSGTYSFKISWAGPVEREGPNDGGANHNRPADDYQAHIVTTYGAGEVTYEFRGEFGGTDFIGMYARVSLSGFSILTVRIRSYYDGEGWGTWSPPIGLYCRPE